MMQSTLNTAGITSRPLALFTPQAVGVVFAMTLRLSAAVLALYRIA
jgi:hypothetical protein